MFYRSTHRHVIDSRVTANNDSKTRLFNNRPAGVGTQLNSTFLIVARSDYNRNEICRHANGMCVTSQFQNCLNSTDCARGHSSVMCENRARVAERVTQCKCNHQTATSVRSYSAISDASALNTMKVDDNQALDMQTSTTRCRRTAN